MWILTKTLNQLAVHNIEVNYLKRELTLHSSSFENVIKSWQIYYHMLKESYLFLRRNIEEL